METATFPMILGALAIVGWEVSDPAIQKQAQTAILQASTPGQSGPHGDDAVAAPSAAAAGDSISGEVAVIAEPTPRPSRRATVPFSS